MSKMIIFLYGEDTYRSSLKLKEIIEKYKKSHKSGVNLKFFNIKDSDYQSFSDQFKINSMFSEKKLVIVKNFFLRKNFQDSFLEEIKSFLDSDDVIVIHEKEKIDKRKKSFKTLSKKTKSQEFKFLKEGKIEQWIKKEFEKTNSKIDQEAVETLINYIGNDLWQASNEIKKLSSYKKEIKKRDVQLLVRPKIETNIFKTIDAIAKKDKKTALNLIKEHLEKGDSPLYILSMINFQFRNLLIVKDFVEKYTPYNLIIKKSNLHPFVVKKSYEQSKKFDFRELKKIYQKILKVDFEIKTGKIDPQIGLEIFIAKI